MDEPYSVRDSIPVAFLLLLLKKRIYEKFNCGLFRTKKEHVNILFGFFGMSGKGKLQGWHLMDKLFIHEIEDS